MRVVRNIGYVKQRKRLARWSALLGFVMLVGTFWLAFNPSLILFAYGPLLIGTLIFHFGMQQLAQWSRPVRNDAILDERLKALNDKYALIHYGKVGKRTVEHILVHPGGVVIVTAREVPGKVIHRKGRWRKSGSGIGRLFGLGGPPVGNPTFETRANVETVDRHLEEAQLAVEVDGLIVFLSPMVELDVVEPDYPVMNADGLVEYVRALPVDDMLRPNERQAIVALLGQGAEVEQPPQTQRRRPVKKRAA